MVLRRVLPIVFVLAIASWVPTLASAEPPRVVLEEVVTDPQQDHDGSGSVTSSDEYVVLRNLGDAEINLTGWRLVMDDGTPAEVTLDGVTGPHASHVVLNPTGVMNNDVRLALVRPDGTVVDEVELGAGGVADGNADGLGDEAVYLHGPWAGARAPAAKGNGLAPVWVEGLAAAGDVPASAAAPWVSGANATIDVLLHVAPHWNGSLDVSIDGERVGLVQQDGDLWRTGTFHATSPRADVVLVAGEWSVAAYLDGTPLQVRVDAAPPRLSEPADAVVNATRTLRWLPAAVDDESGLENSVVWTSDGSARQPLPACADPRQGTPTCPLGTNVTSLVIDAADAVGNEATFTVGIQTDRLPPTMPGRVTFETAVPPTFRWDAFGEPLAGLIVETADDVGGTWNRTATSVPADGRVFTDHAWQPGAPRAYRLLATDRGGHTNATGWIALPPAAVPVQAQAAGLDAVLANLSAGRAAEARVTFDRPMDAFPRLVVHSERPTPVRLGAEPTAAPDGRTAHYVFSPDGAFPGTGRGTWRLEGGKGADDAPVQEVVAAADWDVEPPRIVFSGLPDPWLAKQRHVVVVSAFDRSGSATTLAVDADGATVRPIGPATVEVAVANEGTHTIVATATDAGGRTTSVTKTLRLDATPPRLKVVKMPSTWSNEAPIVLRIEDASSGVDESSLAVAVRDAAGPHEPKVAWNGTFAALRPNGTAREGPFALHLSVRDVAGNQAEGALGEPILRAPMTMEVVVNETRNGSATGGGQNDLPVDTEGQAAPMAGNPTTAWTDLVMPPAEPAQEAASEEDPRSGMTLAASLVSAGVLGLGTAVYRKKRGAQRSLEGKAKGERLG